MAVPSPRRSSAQLATAPAGPGFLAVAAVPALLVATLLVSMLIGVTLPEARSHGFGEVALSHKIPLGVHLDRQLGEGPGGRAEDHPAGVGQVEGRLVAGAEQVVGGALVQRDRAAHVGADLGVAEDAVDRPVLAARAGRDVVGLHPDQDDGGLGLGDLERRRPRSAARRSSSVSKIAAGSALIRSPISRSEALIGVPTTSRTTRMPSVQSVCSRPAPGMPLSLTWLGVGPRSRSMIDGRRRAAPHGAEQRVADQRAATDPGLLEAGGQRGQGLLAVLVGGRRGVAVLDDLVVGHQLARPLDDADADEQQGAAEGQRRGRRWTRRARGRCRGPRRCRG